MTMHNKRHDTSHPIGMSVACRLDVEQTLSTSLSKPSEMLVNKEIDQISLHHYFKPKIDNDE